MEGGEHLADFVVDHQVALAVHGGGIPVDEDDMLAAEITDEAGGGRHE